MTKMVGWRRWAGIIWFGVGIGLSYVGLTKLRLLLNLRYPSLDPKYDVTWGWFVAAAAMIIGPTALLLVLRQIRLGGNVLSLVGWVGLVLPLVIPPTSWYRKLIEPYWWAIYTPGLMASVSYMLTRVPRKSATPDSRIASWDEPKTDPSEDRLGRKPLAKLIADVIASTTSVSPTRIAVYGPWGSGKTTFLSFVRAYLGPRVPVATFNPWKYRSGDAAWNGFIQSVEEALVNHAGEWTRYEVFIRERFGDALRLLRAGWKPQTEVGKKLSDLLFDKISDSIENKKDRLSSVLSSALGHSGRLVVLVDDMDRVDPHIAVDILSRIKELLDFPQLTYVFALDHDALTSALASALKGLDHEGAKRYLEKIVQWPIELSPSTPSQVLEDRDITAALDKLSREALTAISGVLPSNPRQLKRFVWNVAVQYPHDGQDTDLNRSFLYACKLMQMYYPEALRKVVATEDLRKALGLTGQLLMAGGDREKQLKEWRELLFTDLRVSNPEDTDRIWSIFMVMVEQGGPDPSREITLALQGVEDRAAEELFSGVYRAWQMASGSRRRLCTENALQASEVGPRLAWQQVFARALSMRIDSCSRMADLAPEEWVLRELNGAEQLGVFIGDLLDVAAAQSAPTSFLGPEQFASLWRACTAYGNFRRPDYYLPLRSQEEALLWAGVKLIEERPDEYLRLFSGFSPVLSEVEKAAEPLRQYVLDRLLTKRANQIVEMFQQRGAILPRIVDKAFWWDRKLLMDKNKWFHNADVRQRLFSMLRGSKTNPAILDNLYHYFAFLSSPDIPAEIREDRDFVTKLWSLLVAGRLNYRHIGSLYDDKANLERQWRTEGALAIPDDPLWTSHTKK